MSPLWTSAHAAFQYWSLRLSSFFLACALVCVHLHACTLVSLKICIIFYSVAGIIQTIFTTINSCGKINLLPVGKIKRWLVCILLVRTAKASWVPGVFFSSKTHSSMDQSAPKFVNSCPVINSLKWIVFPSNCIQLHTCFYCSPPLLSGIHELSHEKRKNNSFYKLEHVTYKSSLQSPFQL